MPPDLSPFVIMLQVCETMAVHSRRPIIMPLSPTDTKGMAQKSELAALDAYAWTQVRWRVLLAQGRVLHLLGFLEQKRATASAWVRNPAAAQAQRFGGQRQLRGPSRLDLCAPANPAVLHCAPPLAGPRAVCGPAAHDRGGGGPGGRRPLGAAPRTLALLLPRWVMQHPWY